LKELLGPIGGGFTGLINQNLWLFQGWLFRQHFIWNCSSNNWRISIRWLGMFHLQQDRSYAEVASFLCVHEATVKGWSTDSFFLKSDDSFFKFYFLICW
jgi:hypothetical protein